MIRPTRWTSAGDDEVTAERAAEVEDVSWYTPSVTPENFAREPHVPFSPRTLLTLTAGIALGFCGALATGVMADRPRELPRPAQSALPWAEANRFAEVYERIKREYVDEVDDHTLMEKAMRGMVAALDPHSAYLDSEELNEIRLSTMGSYPGVGIEVAAANGVVKVLRPIEGSPARAAGILAGDVLVAIDGREIGADLAGAIARLRGDAGSLVRLSLRRDAAGALLDFSLRRTEVEVHSVTAQTLEPGYGYVRISTFSDTTPEDLSKAILSLKRDNPRGIQGSGARPEKQSGGRARIRRRGGG